MLQQTLQRNVFIFFYFCATTSPLGAQVNTFNPKKYTIADHVVEESYADFLAGKDSQLLFTLNLISGSGQRTDNLPAETDKSGYTKPAVEGQWKFVSAAKAEGTPFLNQYPDPHIFPDEAPLPQLPYVGPDLIFENDTLYQLNYPESISNREQFSLDSGCLLSSFLSHGSACPIEFTNDTLYIYMPYHRREYIKEGYVKTTFDDSIVSILKKQDVNYPELAGTWFLIRQKSVGDGTEYLLEFPHKIPDSIAITREDFITGLEKNRVYLMSTDGKKRDYVFSYKWGYLTLTPGKWYAGEDPWIHFSREQVEN